MKDWSVPQETPSSSWSNLFQRSHMKRKLFTDLRPQPAMVAQPPRILLSPSVALNPSSQSVCTILRSVEESGQMGLSSKADRERQIGLTLSEKAGTGLERRARARSGFISWVLLVPNKGWMNIMSTVYVRLFGLSLKSLLTESHVYPTLLAFNSVAPMKATTCSSKLSWYLSWNQGSNYFFSILPTLILRGSSPSCDMVRVQRSCLQGQWAAVSTNRELMREAPHIDDPFTTITTFTFKIVCFSARQDKTWYHPRFWAGDNVSRSCHPVFGPIVPTGTIDFEG